MTDPVVSKREVQLKFPPPPLITHAWFWVGGFWNCIHGFGNLHVFMRWFLGLRDGGLWVVIKGGAWLVAAFDQCGVRLLLCGLRAVQFVRVGFFLKKKIINI